LGNLLLIASGGALGACLRYFLSNLIKLIHPNVLIGTFIVNILGSFLIGLLMSNLEVKNISENFIRNFLIIGFLGSFTTFSAFSFEIVNLINNQKIFISLLYIFFSVSICVLFAHIGYNLNKI
tara:strand:- start:130 stop:498 length:369 start_codon:yes stop_codon:yes gene_type:complete